MGSNIKKLDYETIKDYEVIDPKPVEKSSADVHDYELKEDILKMLDSFAVLLSKETDKYVPDGAYAFTGLFDKKGNVVTDYHFKNFYNFYLVLVELTSFDYVGSGMVFDDNKKILLSITDVLRLMKLAKSNTNEINGLLLSKEELSVTKLLEFQDTIADLVKSNDSCLSELFLNGKSSQELEVNFFENSQKVNKNCSFIPVNANDVNIKVKRKIPRK